MTTSAEERRRQVDATEVWRAIGQIEGKQDMMLERLDRIEARLDRLLCAMTGVAGCCSWLCLSAGLWANGGVDVHSSISCCGALSICSARWRLC